MGRGLRTGAMIVLVLVVAVVLWMMRPSTREVRDNYGMAMERPVGTQVWFPLISPDPQGAQEVTITSLSPQLKQDGAAVEVEYLVCEHDEEALARQDVDGVGVGFPRRNLERLCARTWPAVGDTFSWSAEPSQELMVGVTTTRPGRSVIRSHELTFREGWRRGTATIDVELKLRATG